MESRPGSLQKAAWALQQRKRKRAGTQVHGLSQLSLVTYIYIYMCSI